MKKRQRAKTMRKLFVLLLSFAFLFLFCGCAEENTENENSASSALSESKSESTHTESQMLAGGWQTPENTEITKELSEIFSIASQGFTGARLVPEKLIGTQVVAGINYKFLCKSYPIEVSAEPKEVTVTVYKDLKGNVKIIDIK